MAPERSAALSDPARMGQGQLGVLEGLRGNEPLMHEIGLLKRSALVTLPQFTEAALQAGELMDRRFHSRIVNDVGDGDHVQPFSWFLRGFFEATGKDTVPWINLQTTKQDEAASVATTSPDEIHRLTEELKDHPRWPGPYDWGESRVLIVTPTIASGRTLDSVTRAVRQAMYEENGRIRAHPPIDVVTAHFDGLDSLHPYEWDTIENNRQRRLIDLEDRGIPLGGGKVYVPQIREWIGPAAQFAFELNQGVSGDFVGESFDGISFAGDRMTQAIRSSLLPLGEQMLRSAGIAAGEAYGTHHLEQMLTAAKRVVTVASLENSNGGKYSSMKGI